GFFIRLTKVSLPSMYTALPPPRDLARRCANGRLAVLDITGGVEPEPAPAGQPLRKDAALGALRAPLSSASDSPGLTLGSQHFRQRTGYQSLRRGNRHPPLRCAHRPPSGPYRSGERHLRQAP